MSSTEDKKPPAFCNPAGEVFEFVTPRICLLDFGKLAKSKLSDMAEENLKIVANNRNRICKIMQVCFDKDTNSPKELKEALEGYLPFIRTLCAQKAASLDKLPIKEKELEFEWWSILTKTEENQVRRHIFKTFADECLQVFFVYGIVHYQLARETVAAPPSSDFLTESKQLSSDDAQTQAVVLLKTAAGIFDYITNSLIPSLGLLDANRPFETWPGFISAMSLICLANAQEFTVCEAVKRGHSDTTIAKLALGVTEKFQAARTHLTKTLGKRAPLVRVSFREYVECKEVYYHALAFVYLSRVATEEGKHGEAVVLLSRSVAMLRTIKFSASRNGAILHFDRTAQFTLQEVEKLHRNAKSDNDKIYYQPLPNLDELKIPAAAFVLKPNQYNPPPLIESEFFSIDDSSGKCVIS